MSLIEIKRYLMQVRIATFSNMCQIFNCHPQTLRCLLAHLVTQGKVRQCKKQAACGSKCVQCPSETTEMYEWLGSGFSS